MLRRLLLLVCSSTILLAAITAPAHATITYVKNGKAYVASDDGSGATRLLLPAVQVAISRDGRYLATIDGKQRVHRLDRTTGEKTLLGLKHALDIEWLTDGRLVITTNPNHGNVTRVYRHDAGGAPVLLKRYRSCSEPGCDGMLLFAATSPLGNRLVVSGMLEFELAVLRPNGSKVCRIGNTGYQVLDVEFAPDGGSFVIAENATRGGANRFVRVDTRTCRRSVLVRISDFLMQFSSPVFSPDGATIAYWLYNSEGSVQFRTIPSTGGKPIRLSGWLPFEPTKIGAIAGWIDDDTLVAGYGGSIRRFDIATKSATSIVTTNGAVDWAPTT